MQISIITPLFNRLELTRACIKSLERTLGKEGYEWIFVDDGSTDGTREFLHTLPADGRFRVILNETPLGFAANNNLGAKVARAPLLCLLNNDTVLLPGWLEPMARLARLLPDVACVGNVQREPISGLIDHAGVCFQHDGYARHVAKDGFAPPREDYLEWPAVTAACCVVRREVFTRLGGFDEAFRNGSEDVDFCLRAGLGGYRHFVANRSVIYHYISSSPGRMRNEEANQRLFHERWFDRLQTDLLRRRSRQEERERGRRYLREHAWHPWRFNRWRVGQAVEQIVSPLPPSQRLDLAPRLFFGAQDLRHRRRTHETTGTTVAALAGTPVFLMVGDTAQTTDRSGVTTAVRRLAAACGRIGAPVTPVIWKPAAHTLDLLPPELSVGLDAEALRPSWIRTADGPSAASIYDPSVGDLHRAYTETPSLHELPLGDLAPEGAWVLLPEVLYQDRARLLLEYVRRLRWKLAVILYDTMPNNEPSLFPQGRANEHEVYLRTVSEADLIFPVSRFVAGDWERFLAAKGLPAPACRVCVPGADLCAAPRVVEPPYRDPAAPVRVLCVSTLTPRKNHRVLVEAFELVFAARPELDIEVCLVGMPELFNEENVPDVVSRFVKRHPGKAQWISRVEYGALCTLYGECDFTVYPSVLEGRGFPIAESLWFGRPCICADIGAMAETAAGGGCVTVDVFHPQVVADAIISLAESPARLADLTAEIAARPLRTWEDYARDLLAGMDGSLPSPEVGIEEDPADHPPMNVLFFCHDDFACNSMAHIAGFASALRVAGDACAVAIPGDDRSSAAILGARPPFHPVVFSDSWKRVGELFPDGRPADIIHVWTPREHVRRAAELCWRGMPAARLVVHLEDNEEHLMALYAGEDWSRLRELPDDELATRLPMHLAHPREYQRFLASANGVTGITERLVDFVPSSVPFIELWPGVDLTFYRPGPPDPSLRRALGIGPAEKVLFYPGSSHFANREEMQNLYEAVFLLNERGCSCRLVRTGWDDEKFTARLDPERLAKYVLHLGVVERSRLPALLRLADVLVQPGRDDAFSRYRLPSKLPEFLASGRPVLMPPANVGLRVRPDQEAIVLQTGDPEEIADQCARVFIDPALSKRLSQGAAAFARRHFDPVSNGRVLARFYRRLLVV